MAELCRCLLELTVRRSHCSHCCNSKNAEKLQSSYCGTSNSAPRIRQATFPKTLLKGPDADIWARSTATEWGRLLEHKTGLDRPPKERIKGTGTLFFVEKSKIPKDRKVTYANFIYTIRPQKKETHRVRMTAGGDQLDYPGDASSPTVAILDAKVHVNSTISDARRGARYVCMDAQNFYLGTPMSYYQYIRVRRHQIPQEICDDLRYEIIEDEDGWIYPEIRRGMYELK